MGNRIEGVEIVAPRSVVPPGAPDRSVRGSASPVPASRRDGALDVMRGYCIASMIASHVGNGTVLCKLMHLPKLFDGAIGFVFLSGLVLGMVHRRRVARLGVAGTRRKLFGRAGLLWSLHVSILLAVMVLQTWLQRMPRVPTAAEAGGWPNVIFATLTFQLQPYLNDILPMYVVFLVLVPLAIAAFNRRLTWLFFCAVVAVYVGAQIEPGWFAFPGQLHYQAATFIVGAWQLPFFLALWIGYNRERLEKQVWPRVRGWALPVAMVAFLSVFLLAQTTRHMLGSQEGIGVWWYERFFARDTVRPGYLLYYLAFLMSAYWMLRRFAGTKTVRWCTGWLQDFGRASLYSYLVHLVIVELLDAVDWETYLRSAAQAEVMTWGILALIYLMARNKVFSKVIPN